MRFFHRLKSKREGSSDKGGCFSRVSLWRFLPNTREKTAAKENQAFEEMQRMLDEARSRLKDDT